MTIDTTKIKNLLHAFVQNSTHIEGVTLVTPEGLPLASTLPELMDEDEVSAMSAAMLSLGERIGSQLYRGNVDRLYVEGDRGYGILTSCGEDAVFLVLANKSAKQGVVLLEIKKILAKLKTLITDFEDELHEVEYNSNGHNRNMAGVLQG